MTAGIDEKLVLHAPAPLFVLSFRHREELAQAANRAGWNAVAARRRAGAEQRFLASGASVAIVDARGALEEGLEALRCLSDPVEANAGALLTLISRSDVASLDAIFAAGATHYLASPFGDAEFAQTVRFAERHAERLAGGGRVSAPLLADAEPERRSDHINRDPLTGLRDGAATRRWIEARLTGGGGITLVLLSLSRFDMINAAFGQAAGDALLSAAARRIESIAVAAAGRRTFIARIAGAEFAIGLGDAISPEKARFIADELSAAVSRPFVAGEHVVPLACRIGMAASEVGETDAAAFLRRASAALAEAKAADSGVVRVLSTAEADNAALHGRLEVDLRRALDQEEIEIVFQPQISVTTGAMVGVEALARWRHPDFGELGAATLFSAAERSEYLVQLSEHVQRRAIEIATGWSSALSALRLSINVTAADIAQPGFTDRFLAIVDSAGVDSKGFPRGRLTVEITESGLIEDLEGAAALLANLRAGGCRVAIDDFGTGYSSLAYLKALPLDYLKIDKKLAEDIAGSSRDRVVVRGVIEMARSLGLSVVAEGVETEEQLSLLASEGCNYYQGFLFSEPLDVLALEALFNPL